jgi:hypothetical protein
MATGRPPADIDKVKLKGLMRLKPTLEDTAAFFEVHPSTIERFIKSEFGLRFAEFRDQNMVHTRFNLIRKAIQKAEGGDNVMLIFCLKNLCQWKDRYQDEEQKTTNIQVNNDVKLTEEQAKELIKIARGQK